MTNLQFKILQPADNDIMQLIADWYLSEWNIPKERTIERLKTIIKDPSQLQLVLLLDQEPIATAGLYHHVGLLDKEPRFKIYQNWLAQVYTIPSMRHRGFGALICNYLQDYSQKLGVKEMYLFTDTAEPLYSRLGWCPIERLSLGKRNIVVMKKDM